ncbi:MAG: hypothetical protein KKB37_15065 [Alphaproteobacteria bacterium]|nr:hypothetical protein [Alphaproteobacteria bacterium]
MKKIIIGASVFSAILAGVLQFGPVGSVTAEAASVCYKGGQAYSKQASGVRKSKAQERARGKWNDYARSLMGTSRANWNNAKYRGYHCKKSGIWYCRAIATPCI